MLNNSPREGRGTWGGGGGLKLKKSRLKCQKSGQRGGGKYSPGGGRGPGTKNIGPKTQKSGLKW